MGFKSWYAQRKSSIHYIMAMGMSFLTAVCLLAAVSTDKWVDMSTGSMGLWTICPEFVSGCCDIDDSCRIDQKCGGTKLEECDNFVTARILAVVAAAVSVITLILHSFFICKCSTGKGWIASLILSKRASTTHSQPQ